MDVLCRAAQTAVQFVFAVHPLLGKTARDRVIRILDFDQELVLRAVCTTVPGDGIAEEFAVFYIQPRAGFFIAPP